MNDPQRIDADILCLAHTERNLEWCDRRENCRRHIDIRAQSIGAFYGVLFRVCQPRAHDQFLEVGK